MPACVGTIVTCRGDPCQKISPIHCTPSSATWRILSPSRVPHTFTIIVVLFVFDINAPTSSLFCQRGHEIGQGCRRVGLTHKGLAYQEAPVAGLSQLQDRLGIADANMLNKLSPFFAIILSIFILKEIPNRFDILTTIIAFIGALFIIRPTGAFTSVFPALIGLLGGFCAGTAYVFVRKLTNNGVKTPVIVFAFSLFSCLVTLPFLLVGYVAMRPIQWLYLILAGVSASLGQFAITTAYKYAPAKEISVFDYTQVIFAALLGLIFLGEVPVLYSLLGYTIIIGIAVLRWHRNLKS